MKGIALSVNFLKIAGGSIADHLAVDHDRDVVTELFSLVHAMRRQQD